MKRAAIVLGATALAALLILAILELGPADIDLRRPVSENMPLSGVTHPVTAVLLNFRGYDTLLEVAVLLIALFGILSVGTEPLPPSIKPADPMLQRLARIACPLVILAGIYLLWAGAFRPGGAFQAGALLAAAIVLLHLSGLWPGWGNPSWWLRLLLAGGFSVFLAVSAAMMDSGALLEYPQAHAGLLILLIESSLTVSLAATLAGLFLFLSRDTGGRP